MGVGSSINPTPILHTPSSSTTRKCSMSINEFATENNLLASALAYASLGYRVLPCHSVINGRCTCGGRPNCKPGKHPLTQHGVKDADTGEATIKAWWAQWPYANVAIATGEMVWA